MDFSANAWYILLMKIGKFAKITGLSVLTVRYYMEIGLIRPQLKDRYWNFTEKELCRAAEIERYKRCGFSLQTITEFLTLCQDGALSAPDRACRLERLFRRERERICENRTSLERALEKLDGMILDIRGQVVTDPFNGIPLPLFALIQCPFCGSPLRWQEVCLEQGQVYSGQGSCHCGFRASVTDGILLVEDLQRPLIPVVDNQLATLQQRSPQDVSYIETFNQWLKLQLDQLELEGKVIFEDVLNTTCFLNRAISGLSENAYYILCDTDLQIVRYYMASIRAAFPHHKLLFIVDDGIHHPLRPGCLDVIIDYAASEIYQKYGYRSSSTPLKRYAHDGTVVAGRFSCLCKKQPGKRDMTESNAIRYRLSVLQQDMRDNGIRILAEKAGDRPVDPSVYTGSLPGDVIKPYAFVGRWKLK